MDEQIFAVTLARIEGKLDLINAEMRAHNTRADDHEKRLRALESRPVLSPKALISTLVAVATVFGSLTPLLAQIYNR